MQFFYYLLVFGSLFFLCMADREIHSLTLASSKCRGKEKASTLLDCSKDFIDKAKDFYPNNVEDEQNCEQKEKSFAFLDVAMNLISEVKKGHATSELGANTEGRNSIERPMDCSEILRSGKNKSGVYTIWPRSRIFTNKSLNVYCDMETNGGGWTVIQRRGNFSTPKDYFYKNWKSYKNGFGNLTEEFWIGNDNIHTISSQAFIDKPYTIRFDLKDAFGKVGYAEYNTFWIEDEASSYTLHIEGYKGDVGDSMSYHSKKKFSTKDQRNDERSVSSSCAVLEQGAWWYGDCAHANLNGLYQPGIDAKNGSFWYHWTDNTVGLSGVEIKLRSN